MYVFSRLFLYFRLCQNGVFVSCPKSRSIHLSEALGIQAKVRSRSFKIQVLIVIEVIIVYDNKAQIYFIELLWLYLTVSIGLFVCL